MIKKLMQETGTKMQVAKESAEGAATRNVFIEGTLDNY